MYPPGTAHLRAMAGSSLRRRLWVLTVQGEDLAQGDNRIDLDPAVRDAWGFPAGRVTYRPHRHELAASAHASAIHEAVLADAGAKAVFSSTSPPQDHIDRHATVNPIGIAPASRHIMGTTRMGDDPATSVVSPEQRLWDVDNVLICDSSVFATSSGYNPTLTLAALAHRAATLLTR
jgi:choline dehydrogenase-like flavoprotein